MITKVKPGECHCCNCCQERKEIIAANKQQAYDKELQQRVSKEKFQVFIGGRVREVHFGRGSVISFFERINNEALESSFKYAVFYAGLMERDFRKQIKRDYNFKDVIGWVDNLNETKEGRKEIQRICKGFLNCPAYKEAVGKIEHINTEQ